jgi:hypothetical protein
LTAKTRSVLIAFSPKRAAEKTGELGHTINQKKVANLPSGRGANSGLAGTFRANGTSNPHAVLVNSQKYPLWGVSIPQITPLLGQAGLTHRGMAKSSQFIIGVGRATPTKRIDFSWQSDVLLL